MFPIVEVDRATTGKRNQISLIFEGTSKFPIVFLRLILGKVGVDGFTRLRGEIDMTYEFDLKVILKDLRCKWRLLQPVLVEFPSNN